MFTKQRGKQIEQRERERERELCKYPTGLSLRLNDPTIFQVSSVLWSGPSLDRRLLGLHSELLGIITQKENSKFILW